MRQTREIDRERGDDLPFSRLEVSCGAALAVAAIFFILLLAEESSSLRADGSGGASAQSSGVRTRRDSLFGAGSLPAVFKAIEIAFKNDEIQIECEMRRDSVMQSLRK
jgi:hypothetical protein